MFMRMGTWAAQSVKRLPWAQVMVLDRVLHWAPFREPTSPSACVSASPSVSLMNK